MNAYRGYLELVRPANVATALADILAGYTVAGLPHTPSLAWLLVSTACLYAGGVVLNDVFDREIDRAERPERPIPSGRVSTASAAGLGSGLLAAGILFGVLTNPTAGVVATATAACVLLYDAWGKRQGLLGPVNMGMTRTAVLNVVGLTPGIVNAAPQLARWAAGAALARIRPAFPAVTCTAQSNYLTGLYPSTHGIVGNGWYAHEDAEIKFWKQSNRLVQAPKIWERARELESTFTCANLFWWYNMSEITLTQRRHREELRA